jgi:hypothetical protein
LTALRVLQRDDELAEVVRRTVADLLELLSYAGSARADAGRTPWA